MLVGRPRLDIGPNQPQRLGRLQPAADQPDPDDLPRHLDPEAPDRLRPAEHRRKPGQHAEEVPGPGVEALLQLHELPIAEAERIGPVREVEADRGVAAHQAGVQLLASSPSLCIEMEIDTRSPWLAVMAKLSTLKPPRKVSVPVENSISTLAFTLSVE